MVTTRVSWRHGPHSSSRCSRRPRRFQTDRTIVAGVWVDYPCAYPVRTSVLSWTISALFRRIASTPLEVRLRRLGRHQSRGDANSAGAKDRSDNWHDFRLSRIARRANVTVGRPAPIWFPRLSRVQIDGPRGLVWTMLSLALDSQEASVCRPRRIASLRALCDQAEKLSKAASALCERLAAQMEATRASVHRALNPNPPLPERRRQARKAVSRRRAKMWPVHSRGDWRRGRCEKMAFDNRRVDATASRETASMTDAVLRRESWNGCPAMRGEAWRLRKAVCGHPRQAVCELWSHQLGSEIRLVIDGGELRRSQVIRSNDEILTVTEQWKAAMVGRGWS